MIGTALHGAVLAVLVTLTAFFARQRASYFKSVKALLVIAFMSIASITLAHMAKKYIIGEAWMMQPYALFVTAASILAFLAIEHAAQILWAQQQGSDQGGHVKYRRALSPLFKAYAVAILVAAWALTPWEVISGVQDLWGDLVFGLAYHRWFSLLFGGLLFAVISYPCTIFLRLSRKTDDKRVSDALWWLGISWSITAVTMTALNAIQGILNIELAEVSSVFSIMSYGVLAYSFRQTTVLEDLLSMRSASLRLREGEHVVVFYTQKVDKWKLFSTYVREGLEKGDRVIYAYPIEDSELVRVKLADHGVEVEKNERTGALVLMDISRVCMRNGVIDKGQLINFWNDFKASTKKKGFRHERDLFDLGDLSFLGDQKDRYFEYLREANAELMDPFMVELRAVNFENLDPAVVRRFKFLSTKSMDLLEYSDRFSKRLQRRHNQVAGRNFLLEFDPTANYEEAVLDFVLEASANAETVLVFTNRGSAIHNRLAGQENVKFLLLTQLSPTPATNRPADGLLISASDLSLLLDTLGRTVRSSNQENLNVIFDNLTSLILQVGFEKTYSFARYSLEMLNSENVTALFLLNPTSHDEKVVSSLRSLFGSQIDFQKAGLGVIKFADLQVKAS